MRTKYANTFMKKSYIVKIYLVCIKYTKDNDFKMNIRKATLNDLEPLMEIYAHARKEMIKNNNPLQWGNIEPERTKIISRIENGFHYIVENNGQICGGFSLIPGKDPTYSHIDGAWLNDLPYLTIHSIASNNTVKGVLKAAIDYGFSHCNTIRIDTHRDNTIMIHLLEKYGFQFCGVIRLENLEPRQAYMKTII